MVFDAFALDAQQRYKLAIGSVVPRPVAVVATVNENGSFNVAPFSFFNVVCVNPLILGIFIQHAPAKGGRKDTARNILRTGEFTIGIATESNVARVNVTSGMYPYGDDEFVRSGLTPVASETIAAPRVAECPVAFECVLHSTSAFGESLSGSDAFFGEVRRIYVDDALVHDFRIDLRGLAPVSRLAGLTYGKVGETFDMERP